ncbi:MAG TPA: hypothetical protein VLE95_00300 [Chlamydiales bacterium]|nr:hypothetical protein [Chlamydiales bacterium]
MAIYNFARSYVNAVDTALELGSVGVAVVEGAVNTVSWPFRNDGNETVFDAVKWIVGWEEIQKARETFWKRSPLSIPDGIQIRDHRSAGKRLGESAGHLVNAGCRFVAANVCLVGGAAIGIGTASNGLGLEAASDGIHMASKNLAKIFWAVTRVTCMAGFLVARLGQKAITEAVSTVCHHPNGTFQTMCGATLLYAASHQIIKAQEAPTTFRKSSHSALAMLALSPMCLLPRLRPF